MMRLYIALLHYPVTNKNDERIASAITTFDLHDLARLSRTYGVKRFFIITPLTDQQRLAERIKGHWTGGYGAAYNPDRKFALEIASVSGSLEETIREIEDAERERPLLIATDAARQNGRSLGYREAKQMIHSDRVLMILFGTAWGLDKAVIEEADYLLDPIVGPTTYNHLSVRTAAAIVLDRLAGRSDMIRRKYEHHRND
ncbi:MAG: RNA methyltransferase [Deltaproteobacteria bacterium]|nr:RNA methyltransferase [Deltaproteobacteria bacterium]